MKVTIRQKSGMNYLYADISVSKIRVKASLGISVKEGSFNKRTEQVKGNAGEETNLLISYMKTSILELIRSLQKEGKLSNHSLKKGIKELKESRTKPTIQSESSTYLVSFAKKHIEQSSVSRKNGTIRQYRVSLNKLISFEEKHRTKLTFEDVNLDFYNLFLLHCTKDLNLAKNTISTHIKNIKMWMNQALVEGLHENRLHQTKFFAKTTEKADTIYLDEEELARIKQASLPSLTLDRVRDIFLLACYTGVRIQDYHKLNTFNLVENGTMLKIETEKTGVTVVIPLHPEAKRVLDKYKGQPKMISHAKFNKYIKDVCRVSRVNKLVSVSRTVGGKKQTSILPKYKLVASHCARRSFATNAYKAGVPTLAIMAITGHKTEKVFLNYVRVSKEEHAKLISTHRFFKKIS